MHINKFFKISIIIAILIIAGSIFYYLIIYLPRQNIELAKQKSLEQSEQCKTRADKFIDETRKSLPSDDFSIDDYTVHFNTKLNTCLVSYEESSTIICVAKSWCLYYKVVDILTNKMLAEEWVGIDGKPVGINNTPYFTSLEELLMSE